MFMSVDWGALLAEFGWWGEALWLVCCGCVVE